MIFRSFAHLLLWAISGLLLLIGLFFSVWLGLWGHVAQSWLIAHLVEIAETYKANETTLVLAVKIAGALGTVLTGIFGVYKAWYYAEINLPRRLKKFIETIDTKIIVAERNDILAAATSQVLSPDESGSGWFNDWRNSQRAKRLENYSRNLSKRLSELNSTIDLLATAKASWEKQKATVHYVMGYEAICRADLAAKSQHATQLEIREHRSKAVAEFQTAANLDTSDPRALGLAAKQSEEMHELDAAIRDWKTAAASAEERGDALGQARALLGAAKCFHRKSFDPSLIQSERRQYWGKVRDLTQDTRTLLGGLRPDAPTDLEMASACILHGIARIRLGAFFQARRALQQARDIYDSRALTFELDHVDTLLGELDDQARAEDQEDGDKQIGAAQPDVAFALLLESVGIGHYERGAEAEAREAFAQAIKLLRRSDTPDQTAQTRIEGRLAEFDERMTND